jgi:transposase
MMQSETTKTGSTIPNDIDALIELVISLQKELQSYEALKECLSIENQLLKEKNEKLLHQLYGCKSEKYLESDKICQRSLFENINAFGSQEKAGTIKSEDEITVPEHKRKKKGRKPLDETLARTDIYHDLPEEEKRCDCGCTKACIGEEVNETLEMTPAKLFVVRHHRMKYACKGCDGVESTGSPVIIAALPAQIVPKSFASPSLLAHLFVSKFSDALPFYRQEKQFLRYGIALPRATMCRWAFNVREKLTPLLELLKEELVSGPLMGVDETTVRVLNEPDKKSKSKCYMWVFCGGPPGKKIIIFRYSSGRDGRVAMKFLGDYHGYVQTDGYAGYNFLDTLEGIIHLACWAHARRKFVEVTRLYNDSDNKNGARKGKADYAIETIAQLYMIEKKALNLSIEERYQLRLEQAKPILDEFKIWLTDNAAIIPPKSLLGEAFKYTISQWPRLINYLKSGIAPIDNNLTENAIRPFVVGRKNWLFSDQPEGAKASAAFYSLIETAKANGLEPYSYLLYLFDHLPHALTIDDWRQLLPTNIMQEELIEFQKKYWGKY